jgi:hypothetical protein
MAAPLMHLTKPRPGLFLLAGISSLAAVACGIAIRRDLSTIPQGQIGFDDMCGLQEYFDGLEAKVTKEPAVASSIDLEGGDGRKTVRGGKARFIFEGSYILKHAKRVLRENWRRLPEEFESAEKFEIEVRWAEKAGVRRVVTDQPAELFIGRESYELPYHVCISELIYGAPLYRQRRIMWGLPDPTPKEATTASSGADAGASEGGAADAGAAETSGN